MIRVYRGKRSEPFYQEWKAQGLLSDKYKLSRDFIEFVNEKCVFCETQGNDEKLFLDYYRPIKGARNSTTGELFKDHYRWLENEWDNFVVICQHCLRSKSNRFPVEGRLAPIDASEKELLKEKRLLLNPFIDHPEKHFFYERNGKIGSHTQKGLTSIDVLSLNRVDLVARRNVESKKFEALCEQYLQYQDDSSLLYAIEENVSPHAGMAGLKRFLLAEMIESGQMPNRKELLSPLRRKIGTNPRYYQLGPAKKPATMESNIIENRDFNDPNGRLLIRDIYGKQRFIESVEICNFRGIKHIHLDFSRSKSKTAPWLMLLGENGIGKSSILQAISITLMGRQAREVLKLKARDFLRHGADLGHVFVKLTGENKPVRLLLSQGSDGFEGEHHISPRVLILSYGSTRLLPPINYPQTNDEQWVRVENLFNPFAPLVNVEQYLTSLQEEDFIKMREAIESLFLEPVLLSREPNGILFEFIEKKEMVLLRDLSDGFRTIIALAADIMMVMKTRWNSMDAEGIVLIDELDAHLHPRWNIEIVIRLRKAFPMVQFIATTHNPLTLRGLDQGELSVILEDNNRNTVISQQLPNQKDLMIDEILTSKLFGLNNTSPEINEKFNEYYLLLSDPNPTREQQEEIKKYQLELHTASMMGTTMRDRLFYDAIDLYLAHQKHRNSELIERDLQHGIMEAIELLERKYLL
ncbi:AAA family ATPase [Paenibacillus sp. GCM10012306]|uniref:AAA family ATPase n=1 Tax=Paenibacillus sp. GCM10012306 TaxID=3317342 RepID=UPI0036224FE3